MFDCLSLQQGSSSEIEEASACPAVGDSYELPYPYVSYTSQSPYVSALLPRGLCVTEENLTYA